MLHSSFANYIRKSSEDMRNLSFTISLKITYNFNVLIT